MCLIPAITIKEGCMIIGGERNWYAVYVKSRHEFVTSGELKQKKIEVFLPSIKKYSQWRDRRKLLDFPLFPGYLFVHIQPTPEEFLSILKTRGVVSFVSLIPGHPTPVPLSEIISLKLMLESGEELNIYSSLKEGTLVRIKRGPLKSAEGVLIKKEDQYIFLVNIHILGRSVGIKIYAEDIEAA